MFTAFFLWKIESDCFVVMFFFLFQSRHHSHVRFVSFSPTINSQSEASNKPLRNFVKVHQHSRLLPVKAKAPQVLFLYGLFLQLITLCGTQQSIVAVRVTCFLLLLCLKRQSIVLVRFLSTYFYSFYYSSCYLRYLLTAISRRDFQLSLYNFEGRLVLQLRRGVLLFLGLPLLGPKI